MCGGVTQQSSLVDDEWACILDLALWSAFDRWGLPVTRAIDARKDFLSLLLGTLNAVDLVQVWSVPWGHLSGYFASIGWLFAEVVWLWTFTFQKRLQLVGSSDTGNHGCHSDWLPQELRLSCLLRK
jgi:hypothetical protein